MNGHTLLILAYLAAHGADAYATTDGAVRVCTVAVDSRGVPFDDWRTVRTLQEARESVEG